MSGRVHEVTILLTDEEYQQICENAARNIREPGQEATFVVSEVLRLAGARSEHVQAWPGRMNEPSEYGPRPPMELVPQTHAGVREEVEEEEAPVPPDEEYGQTVFDKEISDPGAPRVVSGMTIARVPGRRL